MKKIFIILTLLIFASLITIAKEERVASNQSNNYIMPGMKDVFIASNCVCVPLGKIILIRRIDKYGVVKFTKTWTKRSSLFDKNAVDAYAMYESYYQEDGSGDFSKKNVTFFKGEASNKMRVSHLLRFPYQTGYPYVHFGPLELVLDPLTTGYNYLYYEVKVNNPKEWKTIEPDYALEYAPTEWTNINEVNVFDSRLKWYKYDEDRKDFIIPIDKLWEEKEQKQKLKKK